MRNVFWIVLILARGALAGEANLAPGDLALPGGHCGCYHFPVEEKACQTRCLPLVGGTPYQAIVRKPCPGGAVMVEGPADCANVANLLPVPGSSAFLRTVAIACSDIPTCDAIVAARLGNAANELKAAKQAPAEAQTVRNPNNPKMQ